MKTKNMEDSPFEKETKDNEPVEENDDLESILPSYEEEAKKFDKKVEDTEGKKEQKPKSKKTLVIVSIVIIILSLILIPAAFVLGMFVVKVKDKTEDVKKEQNIEEEEEEDKDDLEVKEEDYQCEEVRLTSIKPNDVINEGTEIKGEAYRSWYFEGSFPVEIIDITGKKVASGNATGDWLSGNTDDLNADDLIAFKVTFTNFAPGQAETGTLIFKKDNPSGLPENEKSCEIPVRFESVDTMSLKIYFNNTIEDPDMLECDKVYSTTRVIPFTITTARASLEELLKGPTSSEETQGFMTNIPSGVKINSISIQNGTCYVDFNQTLQEGVGGSCRVSAIRAQIAETLKQFSSIDNVVISINGETENILQP